MVAVAGSKAGGELRAVTLARVEQLFALALDESTTEEERRTAALMGVRLLRRLGLRVVDPKATPAPQAPPPRSYAPPWAHWPQQTYTEPPKQPRPGKQRRKPPSGGIWVPSAHCHRCDDCGDIIERGDRMYVVDVRDDVQHWCGRH